MYNQYTSRACDGIACGPYDTRECSKRWAARKRQFATENPHFEDPNQYYDPDEDFGRTYPTPMPYDYWNPPRSKHYPDETVPIYSVNYPKRTTSRQLDPAHFNEYEFGPYNRDRREMYPDETGFVPNPNLLDADEAPDYWGADMRPADLLPLEKIRRDYWCKTPMTTYMATHGDLAAKMLRGQIRVKREVNGEPPCSVCEYIVPPCRGYCREEECYDPSLDVTCGGVHLANRDKLDRYWNPCYETKCDRENLAFPLSGLIDRLKKRNK